MSIVVFKSCCATPVIIFIEPNEEAAMGSIVASHSCTTYLCGSLIVLCTLRGVYKKQSDVSSDRFRKHV